MTTTIRDRTHHDLNPCADVLAQVHEHDGYPVNWPAAPDAWLTPPALLHAWVAELHGTLTGHIGLSRSDPGDAAPACGAPAQGRAPTRPP